MLVFSTVVAKLARIESLASSRTENLRPRTPKQRTPAATGTASILDTYVGQPQNKIPPIEKEMGLIERVNSMGAHN